MGETTEEIEEEIGLYDGAILRCRKEVIMKINRDPGEKKTPGRKAFSEGREYLLRWDEDRGEWYTIDDCGNPIDPHDLSAEFIHRHFKVVG